MQKKLNIKVKYRESFRPFAPSVLREDVLEWFNLDDDSPYMLLVSNVDKKKCIEMNDEQKSVRANMKNMFEMNTVNKKRLN